MSLTPELAKLRDEIREVAVAYGLDFFDTVFELVDSDQVNSLAAMGGFPSRYPHWRFGMSYDQLAKGYEWGLSKIYEMVINTDPAYAYLMRSNATVDQKTVIAHVYAHVDFFKNNYWFSKTNRKMLDNMANHASKVREFMDRYGYEPVENFIDQCLALENLIDAGLPFQTQRRDSDEAPKTGDNEEGRLKVSRPYLDKYINPPEFLAEQKKKRDDEAKKQKKNPPSPQKDILLFLLENAPLETWEQQVLAMIRDEAYYFLPQGQTKIMNEGWASYWHSKILTEKVLKASEIIDFADHNASVMAMAPGQINPYKIGVELYRDIEDRWNRGKFGKDYDDCDNLVEKDKWDKKLGLGKQKIFEVRKVCNDITFIDQYMTEEFAHRMKLYTYAYNRRTNQHEIVDRDYRKVKEKLLFQLTNFGQPFMEVTDGNYDNRGELLVSHRHQGLDLDLRWSRETMSALSRVWRRPVNVETLFDGQKKLLSYNGGEFTEKFI